MKIVVMICTCLGCIFTCGAALGGDPLRTSIRLQAEAGHRAIQSQQRVDLLFDEQQRLLHEYKQTRNELQSLRRYDEHLQRMVSAQEQRIIALQQQMEEVTVTHREVVPLMSRMIETLARFIELDVPFLLQERRQRVERLRRLLNRPDVSVAEKYRQVMEAYQIETEFGHTIEVYRGTLESKNRNKTVEFLRIGRLALIYRTIDSSDSAVWDPQGRFWRPLSDDYHSSLNRGFRIARKQVVPNLIKLLVSAPEVVH